MQYPDIGLALQAAPHVIEHLQCMHSKNESWNASGNTQTCACGYNCVCVCVCGKSAGVLHYNRRTTNISPHIGHNS